MPINRLLAIIWSGILLKEFWMFDLKTLQGGLSLLGALLIPVIFWCFYEKHDDVRRWNKLVWFNVLWSSLVLPIFKIMLNTASPITVLVINYWGSC